ncbi:hypothetical protein HF086_003311 [Spodoptera exigua]|uniref:Uncharacterized protein n=1 Tax=Spodoptera exigua TaxID=7107 RepID=A0A922MYB9_SPOEX|nr:hypothetical protein HF086_003311 [Spodoptera exigua]
MVYEALVQSIIGYCITTWRGACKTKMVRAHSDFESEPIEASLFPTSNSPILRVRELYIKLTVLLKHANLPNERSMRVALPRRNHVLSEPYGLT